MCVCLSRTQLTGLGGISEPTEKNSVFVQGEILKENKDFILFPSFLI